VSGGFPHPSRPGHYRQVLPEDLWAYLTLVATAMIPGGEGYPSGAEAQVVGFVQDRASADDVVALQQLMVRWPASSASEAVVAATSMELEDPASFVYLRELLYHGYYSSHRVLAALTDRGYAYRGAPQPLGYEITETMSVPTVARGSYLPTEEVTRVAD
jgi:hypothetical protein